MRISDWSSDVCSSDLILESITRTTVIELLREKGRTVVERDVDRSEIVAADEAFFCGTAWEVTPVTMIDRLPVGNGKMGEITGKLQADYFDVCSGGTGDRKSVG